MLDAANRLGFQMNRQAIDFRRGRSNAFVVLVSDIANPFYSEFFKGIEERARESEYIVLIGDTAAASSSEATYVNMLYTGKADGLISNIGRVPVELIAPHNPQSRRPVVSCTSDPTADVPTVRIDNYRAARAVGEYLLKLGHTEMAILHGNLSFDDLRARLAGFCDVAAEAGHPIPPWRQVEGDLSIASGRQLASALMKTAVPPTAIFAHNDEMALGAIHQLSLMGHSVPRDVSVCGFDDLNYANAITPPLTTVHLPRRIWGAAACKKLLDMLEGRTVEHDTVIPAELIIRGSTAAALSASG